MSEEEVVKEIYSLKGSPCHPEVADRVERHIRLPNGDVMRSYIQLEPEREPEEGDVLTIESASKSTPESRARSFDASARRSIAKLSTCRSSRETGLADATRLAGEGERPVKWAYSQLDKRFQTEERKLLVEEIRWLAEQQAFETNRERLLAESEMEAEMGRLRQEGRHEEADALMSEWNREDKVVWPGPTS